MINTIKLLARLTEKKGEGNTNIKNETEDPIFLSRMIMKCYKQL